MAIKATIFRCNLQVSDIDHGYYADHALTLARHPSETDERMMVRLMALAFQVYQLQTLCHGDGRMDFGAGLSDPDEPDVFLTDFIGHKRLWIEVGQPDDKPLTKACAKADRVIVYAFHSAASVWWQAIERKLTRLSNLEIWAVPSHSAQQLAQLAQRSMQLQALLQDGTLTLRSEQGAVAIECERWK